MNKLLTALNKTKITKDNIPLERLEIEMVRETIFEYCAKYLDTASKVFVFEADKKTIDAVLNCLHTPKFLEKYEFQQLEETIFAIKMREYNLL